MSTLRLSNPLVLKAVDISTESPLFTLFSRSAVGRLSWQHQVSIPVPVTSFPCAAPALPYISWHNSFDYQSGADLTVGKILRFTLTQALRHTALLLHAA